MQHFAQVGWVKDNVPHTTGNGMLLLLAKFGIPNYLSNGQEEKGWLVSDGNIRTVG